MCPYCGSISCISETIYRNVEDYGSNVFHVPCEDCGQMIRVVATFVIKILSIDKSERPKNKSDFQLNSLNKDKL